MRHLLVAILIAWSVADQASSTDPAEHVLISLSGENTVALFDPSAGRVVTTFPAVLGPHEITLSRDRALAFVANAGSGPGGRPGGHVTRIDLRARTAKQLATAPHAHPHDVRVSRDGHLLWVAVAPSRAVIEMEAATGRVRRAYDVQRDGGWFVVATPDDRHLFVPLLEGEGLVLVDRDSGRSQVALSGGAFSGAAVSPNGAEVWAFEHENRRLHVVAGATGERITSIPVDRADFGRLQFTPDGSRVVLVQGKRLLVFDAAARRQHAALDMPLDGKVVAISSSGSRAVVSNPADDQVTIVDLTRMQITGSFPAGQTPDGVAWVPAPIRN
jgi:DNA-binding beta-propeller fold protein YncE